MPELFRRAVFEEAVQPGFVDALPEEKGPPVFRFGIQENIRRGQDEGRRFRAGQAGDDPGEYQVSGFACISG